MDNADLMYRLSGGFTLLSGLYNALISFILFLTLIWICVGVWFLIPMMLSVVQITAGIVMLVMGRKQKELGFLPALGMLTSMLNFNITALFFDMAALVLGIVGYTQAQQLEAEAAKVRQLELQG